MSGFLCFLAPFISLQRERERKRMKEDKGGKKCLNREHRLFHPRMMFASSVITNLREVAGPRACHSALAKASIV